MPESRVIPTDVFKDVLPWLAENSPFGAIDAFPGGPTVVDILDYLIPQTAVEGAIAATPLGVLRVAKPGAIARKITGRGRGLDYNTVMRMFDDAIRDTKAIRKRSTGEVFTSDPGKPAAYHEKLIQEMADQGYLGGNLEDVAKEVQHGFTYGDEFVSESDLESALLDVLSNVRAR